MFLSSSFSALRALLLAASLAPSVLSLPAARPLQLARRATSALAARAPSDYLDSIIYIDKNETNLYLAIEVQQQTYAAYLDSTWGGLILYDGKYAAANGSVHSITIDESISIQVQDGRESVGIFEEEVTLEYFTAGSWPSGMPRVDYDNIKWGYMGINMNEPMNPMYSYLDAKWPNDYSKWYYDMLTFYDWSTAYESSSPVDFAGIMVAGQTLTWEDLGLSSANVTEYGLPDLMGINNQPYVWSRNDGTFYIDDYFWISGKQQYVNSSVPKVDAGKVVVELDTATRWSMFPDSIVDGLYKGISGSKYIKQSTFGYYQIPCDTEISFSISIGGTKYPVFTESLVAKNPWGDQCIGSVFTKGEAVAAVPNFDIIFGFQFLSAFYYRAGLSQQSNTPYYKFLPIQPSNNNWKTAAGSYQTTYSGAATTTWTGAASSVTSYASGSGTLYSSASTYTYTTSSSSSWATTSSTPSTTYTTTYSTSSSSSNWHASSSPSTYSYVTTTTHASTYPTGSASTYSYASSSDAAYASGTPAAPIAGNLAAEDDENTSNNNSYNYYKSKAKLYEILVVVLASLLGVAVIGGLIACIAGCRRKKDATGPSAYRSLHDAEAREPKAPLYGAEGGSSRYSDPYQDKE